MTTPITQDQAIDIAWSLDKYSGLIAGNAIRSLVAQIEALTAERDAALSASRYETDLCGQALADLKKITAERDGLAAAIRQTLEENGHLADGDVCTLKALKDALAADGAKTCAWTEDTDGYYATACGVAYAFNDGTPSENNAVYCHHCGGKLIEAAYSTQEPT